MLEHPLLLHVFIGSLGVFNFFLYKKQFPSGSGMVASLLLLQVSVDAACLETAGTKVPFGVENPPGYALTTSFLPKPDPREWVPCGPAALGHCLRLPRLDLGVGC